VVEGLITVSALGLAGLGFFLALGVKGFGGVLSDRPRPSSRVGFMDTELFPDEVWNDLYRVIGELVTNWGLFEVNLVALIAQLWHDYNGKSHTQELPVSFKRRLALIKLCFNRHPDLAPYAERARELRSKAKEMGFIRNYIAHGGLSLYNTETKAFTFVRLDNEDGDQMHVESKFVTDLQKLQAATVTIQALFDICHGLNVALIDRNS
jgi:hypothetical protein